MKSLESLIPSSISEAIGGTLMHALWQLCALALVLMALFALVPQAAARLRYWMAVSTLGLMVALPIGTFAYLYSPSAPPPPRVAPLSLQAGIHSTGITPIHPPVDASTAGSLGGQVTAFFRDHGDLCLGFWMAGVVLLSLRFLGGCWHVQRLRSRNVHSVPEGLWLRFKGLLDEMGIQRKVGLRLSAAITTPMVVGTFKPMVLLPAGLLTGLPPEQVECILIHELAHVRRWDYLVNILQSVGEILLFFHPATWWVSRKIRQERENCCDEWVVRLKSNKVQYARALLSLEVFRQQPPLLALTSQGGDLASRIRRITGAVAPQERGLRSRGLLFGLITVTCVLLLASQTHTVVKAAFPFLASPKPTEQKIALPEDANCAPATAQLEPKRDMDSNAPALRAALRLASLLGHVEFNCAAQDSPVTKVIMNDKGDEVVLSFGKGGEVVAATRNGKAVPKEDLMRYQEMANAFFRGGSAEEIPPLPELPALPPIPGVPSMRDLPPMPEMPALPLMPPFPAFPPVKDPSAAGFDEQQFKAQMETYAKQMEDWGKNYARQFETREWQQYGEDAGRWGEAFAGEWMDGKETKDMQALQKEMERLHEEIRATQDPARAEELESQYEDAAARLDDLHSESVDRSMEAFERKMEAWGERFAAEMERYTYLQDQRSEEMARRMEAEMERAEAIADHDAARINHAHGAIVRELGRDGLIEDNGSYKFKINDKDLVVNGKKQSDNLHRKYSALVEELLGSELDREWVTFEHRVK